MDQALFTVKLLKESKSFSGLKNELFYSHQIHSKNIPLLISSQLLRSRNLGQVDIASITSSKEIEIIEVKSSEQGSYLGRLQYQRLKNSLNFLTLIFNLRGRIKVLN